MDRCFTTLKNTVWKPSAVLHPTEPPTPINSLLSTLNVRIVNSIRFQNVGVINAHLIGKIGEQPGVEQQQIVQSSYMTHLKLTIRNLTPKDFAAYRCVAKNPRGETDGTIKVYRKYRI